MDAKSLRSLRPELELFLSRYTPLFGRDENHVHAMGIVQGLLAAGERRNVENIAESVDGVWFAPCRSLSRRPRGMTKRC
jgi:hypothetical protein